MHSCKIYTILKRTSYKKNNHNRKELKHKKKFHIIFTTQYGIQKPYIKVLLSSLLCRVYDELYRSLPPQGSYDEVNFAN